MAFQRPPPPCPFETAVRAAYFPDLIRLAFVPADYVDLIGLNHADKPDMSLFRMPSLRTVVICCAVFSVMFNSLAIWRLGRLSPIKQTNEVFRVFLLPAKTVSVRISKRLLHWQHPYL